MAHRLRHRVELQEPVESKNAEHDTGRTWRTVAMPWADVKPRSGFEFLRADQVASDITHVVIMRWLEFLDQPGAINENPRSSYRILHRGRALDIVRVIDEEERRIFMHLLCREDVGAR